MQMIKGVRIHSYGDVSVLQYEDVKLAEPLANEVRVRFSYSGVNFADIYLRNGLYKFPSLPATLGLEGVGVIEALGSKISNLRIGQRVACVGMGMKSYATAGNISADKIILLPDELSDTAAAGAMLRGMTAVMLLEKIYKVQAGDNVLVQAAAGGLGLILVQWIKMLGGIVIGTVGNEEKAKLAKQYGADHTILYREENLINKIKEFTHNQGVDFAIDGVGGKDLIQVAKAVRRGGMLSSIGQVAGQIDETELKRFCSEHSINFNKPSVIGFMQDTSNYCLAAEIAIKKLLSGLEIKINKILPLSDAAQAQELLEGAKTSGSILLNTNS